MSTGLPLIKIPKETTLVTKLPTLDILEFSAATMPDLSVVVQPCVTPLPLDGDQLFHCPSTSDDNLNAAVDHDGYF